MTTEATANNDVTSQQNSDNNQTIDPKKLLEFGSKQIISLFVPVSICMLMVGIVAKTVNYYSTTEQFFIYTPFHTKNADVGTTLWQSLANALIMMSFIVVMSIGLVLLYKYRCYKCINGYLIVSTLLIVFVVFTLFFIQVVIAMNIFMDYLTMAMLVWNIGIMGFLSIHWKGPLIIQQSYLIVISANVALILLKFMPQWTTWVILAALAIWGKVLNKTVGSCETTNVNTNVNLPDQRGAINSSPNAQVQITDGRSRAMQNIRNINDDVMDRGDRGVKLGLGDFVFYSLLMGRATLGGDPNTILACYVAILIGMFLTILLLTVAGRALPALPISMACGILFYFTTSLIITPFTNALVLNRVFL